MDDRVGSVSARAGRRGAFRGAPALLLFAGALLVALLFYHEVLGYSLLGHDTYPIIRAARIETPADLAGTFTEELMDGAYPEGRFYRPVLNLSFALDHAVYRLRPAGFHATDLLLVALAALVAALLASPRVGSAGNIRLAGAAAALLFLAHPVHLNVLPVTARRGDTLALLFTAIALAWSARRPSSRWGPAVSALLAAGAKETGAIAPLLLFVQGLVPAAPGERWSARRALRAALPAAIAVLLFFAARQTVIGGLGGHRPLSWDALARQGPLVFTWILRYAASPFLTLGPLLGSRGAGVLLLFVVGIGSIAAFRDRGARRAAILAWAWILLGAAVHVPSLSISPWYAIHTAFPFAILSGLLLEGAIRALRSSPRAVARVAAGVLLLALLWPAALNVRGTPLLSFYPEWKDASRRVDRYLAGLDERLRAARPGETIDAPGLPFLSRHRAGSPIAIVAPIADYSVEAWAALVFPDRKVRVARSAPAPAPPAADEILVVVSPGR